MRQVPEQWHGAVPPARALRSPVVAIGTFDGVHRGHQALLTCAVDHARATAGEAVALTFAPHPATVFAPDRAPPALTTLADRVALIGATGISLVICQPFDRTLADRDASWFVERLLVEALGVQEVVVGPDFTYGRGREGNVTSLREAASRHGFVATVMEPVLDDGEVVSSTRIRRLVAEGDVAAAGRLLGRPFFVTGQVVRGDGRGSTIGVPTANVKPAPVYADGDLRVQTLLPRPGVYAGRLTLLDGDLVYAAASTSAGGRDGAGAERPVDAPAVINLGRKPTFVAAGALTLEAHVLDGTFELRGRQVRVDLLAHLRDEQKFSTPVELVAQIRRDIESARQFTSSQRKAG